MFPKCLRGWKRILHWVARKRDQAMIHLSDLSYLLECVNEEGK
jgi:hypothetical protein